MALDFPSLQTFQANSMARVSSGVGGRLVTTLRSDSCSGRMSASCTGMPPEMFFCTHFRGAADAFVRSPFSGLPPGRGRPWLHALLVESEPSARRGFFLV